MNYLKFALLLVLIPGFVSCGDEYYDDEYLKNSDEKLCNKLWMREFMDGERKCEQTLQFFKNNNENTGTETTTFYVLVDGKWKKEESNNYYFNWSWINNMEGIQVKRTGRDAYYIHGAWVRDYYLTGNYEGEPITFQYMR